VLISRICALCLLLLLLPGMALAFTPTFESVRTSMAEQMEGLKDYQVDLVPAFDRTLLIRHWQSGQLWRQEWTQDDGAKRLLVAALGQGGTLSASFPGYRAMPLPLLWQWRQASRSMIETWRINTGVMSYQFLEDRPCLVLGAEYGQTSLPQLWVDNELTVPLRLIVPGIDLRWLSYHKVGNLWLPARLVVLFPDTDAFAFEVNWRSVNAAMAPELFSKDRFLSAYGGQRAISQLPPSIQPLFDRFPKTSAQ
jgi:hypothetical protein